MLPKTSTNAKIGNGQTKWIYFLIEDVILLKNIILYEINSELILKMNLIVNLSTIKKILKTKIQSYGNEATNFHNKEIPLAGSDYTCLAVVSTDSTLK